MKERVLDYLNKELLKKYKKFDKSLSVIEKHRLLNSIRELKGHITVIELL